MYGRHKKAITMHKVQLKQERETFVVCEESRHREKKGGSQVTARARERERRRYSM